MDIKTILPPISGVIAMILGILILKYREGDFDPYKFLDSKTKFSKFGKLKKLLLIFYYERVYRSVEIICSRGFISTSIIILIIILLQLPNAKNDDLKNLYSSLLWALPILGSISVVFLNFYVKYLQHKIKR